MTAKHERTPDIEEVCSAYVQYHHFQSYGMDDSEETEKSFYRMIAQVEAAAEQRGAVTVMDALKREASDPGWEGIVQPGRSLQELVDHIEHGIRADQMEGDDE